MIANPNIKGVEDANVPLDFSEIFWICSWGSEHKFPNLLLCATCLHFVDGWFLIEFLAVWKCRLGASYMYMYTVSENIHFMRRVINTAMYKMIHFFYLKKCHQTRVSFCLIVRYMTRSSSFIHLKKRNNVYTSLQNTDWIR